MRCDPTTISLSNSVLWHRPTSADHAFLSVENIWSDGKSLELSILTPFISGCVPPQVALAYSSRMFAASCDLSAPPPSADDASALRLVSIVSMFMGYASLAHARAPVDWMQHADAALSFWASRFGVDVGGVLEQLKVIAQP
jgi:hypothetical protein